VHDDAREVEAVIEAGGPTAWRVVRLLGAG
jgi:hypothetical protein